MVLDDIRAKVPHEFVHLSLPICVIRSEGPDVPMKTSLLRVTTTKSGRNRCGRSMLSLRLWFLATATVVLNGVVRGQENVTVANSTGSANSTVDVLTNSSLLPSNITEPLNEFISLNSTASNITFGSEDSVSNGTVVPTLSPASLNSSTAPTTSTRFPTAVPTISPTNASFPESSPTAVPNAVPTVSPTEAKRPQTSNNSTPANLSGPGVSQSLVQPFNSTQTCPHGYICSDNEMANCTLIRLQAVEVFGYGDIHAGMYCPSGKSNYQNCDAGYYCPDPETKILCPSGKFCPHKTAVPEIDCDRCQAGDKYLRRELYGYIVIFMLLGIGSLYIVYKLIKNYRAEILYRFLDLAERKVDSLRQSTNPELKSKIGPQLERIMKRAMESEILEESREEPYDPEKLSSRFDAGKVFDLKDSNRKGVLGYVELNSVMQLNQLQLRHFILKANSLRQVPPETTEIDRRSFSRFCVDILAECRYYGSTEDEIIDLFREIAKSGPTSKTGELKPEAFFASPLAGLLTESQINDLLKRFRRVKREEHESMSDAHDSPFSLRSISHVKEMSFFGTVELSTRDSDDIGLELFTTYYTNLLQAVFLEPDTAPSLIDFPHSDRGAMVDIAFEDLGLDVSVGENSVNVVDSVTGRLQAGTMTALMGGSGAGKTSLLNALCGRAFYGRTTGSIKVNGRETSIEEHSGLIGFVPQDDIVYAELTVRENFIYSGKFRMPAGTPLQEIEDLADETLANLGLTRVANSLVGDVRRRGVSGGEKKRVNIGLELMARPRVIFLDEPTSGLDSSSALLVMQSLKNLSESQAVTICSVIHQPRANIFTLFDSLVLLGVGGRLVYHGPPEGSQEYFSKLGFSLPPGESVADWLIDISSGRIGRDELYDEEAAEDTNKDSDAELLSLIGFGKSEIEKAKMRREYLYNAWKEHFKNLSRNELEPYLAGPPSILPIAGRRPGFSQQLQNQVKRCFLIARRNAFSKLVDTMIIVGAVLLVTLFEGIVEVTVEDTADVRFENLVSPNPRDTIKEFPSMFAFAVRSKLVGYSYKVSIIASVLIGLTAAKALTEKRLEFFRESGSGYSVNAYFLAINFVASIEHSAQVIISACIAYWIRDSIAMWHSYYINFVMLNWICVSWAMLVPLVVPPSNVVLALGFYMSFFGLLFSGSTPPVTFDKIYGQNKVLALFSGFFSPTRYFVESITVAEYRCLPPQTGFTIESDSSLPAGYGAFSMLSYGQNDSSITERSCGGWYWGMLPCFFVGLIVRLIAAGAIHISGRSKQAKRPIKEELKDPTVLKTVVAYLLFVIVLIVVCGFLILRKT